MTGIEVRSYYDQYHSARGERAWRPAEAYHAFLNCLDLRPGRKLLDVGCGTGHLLKAASDRGLRTFGLDISGEGIRIAKRVSPDSDIVEGSAEDLSFSDGSFDYVTCIGALEHVLDIPKGLAELSRVAKADGTCCVVVPNVDYLLWRVKRRKGTEQQTLKETLLSLREWRQLFLESDFEIVSVHKDLWPAKVPVFSSARPLEIAKRLAYRSFFAAHPINVTYQFVFVLKKSA